MARAKVSKLPSWYDIGRAEKSAKDILWELFYRTRGLRDYPHHLTIGLERLETTCQMALHLIDFMKQRGVTTIEELADRLHIEGEAVEVLGWLRDPVAFRRAPNARNKEYLLALCDLEWDENEKAYRPIHATRPE